MPHEWSSGLPKRNGERYAKEYARPVVYGYTVAPKYPRAEQAKGAAPVGGPTVPAGAPEVAGPCAGGSDRHDGGASGTAADENEVLVGMRVQVIEDDEPLPPEMVRAEVILAQADGPGVYQKAIEVLRKYAATKYRVSGSRLHNRALLAFHAYFPKDRADALAKDTSARWTTRVPGGGLQNSRRRHMLHIGMKLWTATGAQTADEFSAILRRGNINILDLALSAHPVLGPDGEWSEPRSAVLEMTVEVDPKKRAQWDEVYALLRATAERNKWTMPDAEILD